MATFPSQVAACPPAAWPRCCLLASSPGPALPPGYIDRPTSCLTRNSVDSTPAQRLVAFAQLMPLTDSPRPAPASQWPLQAQSFLLWASPGLAPACSSALQAQPLPLSGPSRPSSWPHHGLSQAQLVPL
ncbi:putative uncharacterized protein FLJ44672 [Aotus nancymaae]|uniref:putative uncharacterized protein FLJ44672 n=1 Tax=Aotus nancymaae TaxID=37293 RepID=UPI0030FF04E2